MSARQRDLRVDKLPQWAQNYIAGLELAADSADARVAQADARREEARLATAPDESRIVLDMRRGGEVGIPDDSRVRFYLADRDDIENRQWRRYLDMRINEQYPDMVEIMGGCGLSVDSHASNVVRVRVRDW